MKAKKGEYGYTVWYKKKWMAVTVLLFLAMAIIIGFGHWRYHSMKNIFTVMGILFSLPIARVLSSLLVVIPLKTLDGKRKTELEQNLSSVPKEQILWDLPLSSVEKVRYFPCVLFSDQTVLVFYETEKAGEAKEAEKYFRNLLKNNCHRVGFLFLTEEKQLIKKAKEIDWTIKDREETERIRQTICVYEM
jgi:hypothetical protein